MEIVEKYIKEIEEDLKIDEFNIKETPKNLQSNTHTREVAWLKAHLRPF